MLRALGDPQSFVLLVLSLVVFLTLTGWVTALLGARQDRSTGGSTLGAQGRLAPDPRRQLDPFGVVAALIAGVGWAKPVEPSSRVGRAGRLALTVLTGPVLVLALGLGLLVAFRALSGVGLPPDVPYSAVLQQGSGALLPLPFGQRALLLSGLAGTYVGALALVPLPPLPAGQILFAAAPRTAGWQKAELQLVERNIGVAIVLALLLLPLGGDRALLPVVLDAVLSPVVSLVTGG